MVKYFFIKYSVEKVAVVHSSSETRFVKINKVSAKCDEENKL